MSSPPPYPDDDPYWGSLPDNWYGRQCHLYQNPTGQYKCQVCVLVNRHDFYHWKQAIVQFNTGGYTGAYQIYVARVSLHRNGVLTKWTDYNQWYNVTSGVEFDKNTPWDTDCSDSFQWQATGYQFNIKWLDATTTGVQTLNSATITQAC